MAGGLPRLLTDRTHKFVWGANGLAYNLTLGGSPSVETYHADQIGSIREITNSDGSVRTTYLTDEYGNRTTVKGTDDQPFQFTGEQVDPESGLIYLRARYYDTGTGRFATRDPVHGGDNGYNYTGNNPINWTDQNGAQVIDEPFPCTLWQPGCWTEIPPPPPLFLDSIAPAESPKQTFLQPCPGTDAFPSEKAFGPRNRRALGLAGGPEGGAQYCHVNVQATPGTNFHVYWIGTDFVTDEPGFLSLGDDATIAATTTSFHVATEIATFTGEDVSSVFDWVHGD